MDALITKGSTARDLEEWLRPLASGTILQYRLSFVNGGIVAHHPYYSDCWRRFELPCTSEEVSDG